MHSSCLPRPEHRLRRDTVSVIDVSSAVRKRTSGGSIPEQESTLSDFTLLDQNGAPWTLSHHQARGAVVLIFYRGDW